VSKGTLTTRETEILSFVSKGLSHKQIASALGIGTQTVKNHMSHILDNLTAHNAPHAVAIAIQTGIL